MLCAPKSWSKYAKDSGHKNQILFSGKETRKRRIRSEEGDGKSRKQNETHWRNGRKEKCRVSQSGKEAMTSQSLDDDFTFFSLSSLLRELGSLCLDHSIRVVPSVPTLDAALLSSFRAGT